MRLLYTDISQSLTEILVNQAASFAKSGYRVFYIAPNSLSFEKERAVLEHLEEEASFAITVTRFTQMARYFTINSKRSGKTLTDNALTMFFYRALLLIAPKDLSIYGPLKRDLTFIKQLVDLYKELKTSNISILDLHLDNEERKNDLIAIFAMVSDLIRQDQFEDQTPLAYFAQAICSRELEKELSKTVVVIDGFTRFTAEEDYLVSLLNDKCHQVVIGTYISQKAFQKSFVKGNVYQASIEFMGQLSKDYHCKAEFMSSSMVYPETFSKLSRLFEAKNDFSELDIVLEEDDKSAIAIWQNPNQKEEIEHVAKAIRQKLYEGYRYKDILVLLGDVEAYQLQIGPIFDKYDIPYYFGKSESMSHHPLVHFMESLERSKRYNWRREDIINLVKSGLFGHFENTSIDQFEYYLDYADINGFTKFSRPFSINPKGKQDLPIFHLESLNHLRKQLFDPLATLFKSQQQLGKSLMKKLVFFFETIDLTGNFQQLSEEESENDREKNDEVWKVFISILEEFQLIFAEEKLSLDDALSLLKVAMQAAEYRAVPATLDVVTVTSYDLVQAHSNAFVYALGLTQTHFPKHSKNSSLISDDERLMTNDRQDQFHRLEIASYENGKKNHYTALSLFNAATKELVLSQPSLINEMSDHSSPYLLDLIHFGVPLIEKGKNQFSNRETDIGHYKSLLSQLIDINRQALDQEFSPEDNNFWTVMLRYLKKRLKENKISFQEQKNHLQTKKLAPEVLARRFPEDKPLSLSSSALSVFYNNQYKYYLQYVLGLEEKGSIHPDARQHGTYLHKVFEVIMSDHSAASFDAKVQKAIEEVNQETSFKTFYQQDAQGEFSLRQLEAIVKSTARILDLSQSIKVLKQEDHFKIALGKELLINGTIDRIDQLPDASVGIVDYKSSAQAFEIDQFYNGLSPQLVTYLTALKDNNPDGKLFGAMYLHMQDPKFDLKKYKQLDEKVLTDFYSEMTYKGIFLETEKEYLSNGLYKTSKNLYSEQEIDLLIQFNKHLYYKALEQIKSGHFLINPYSKDGRSVQGDQLKAITGFESDLDLGQARLLVKGSSNEKRQEFLSLMEKEVRSK
ncbi:ATP-dependent nuclease subunit B [Streptococcus iniae]|uniref:ATP-dependent nuclease subunit B n=1 Tax=Streptococcus iniae TaxID=1346 RepID=UPI000EF781A4|nr:ATP-dependent nuclease subunit B [Streptococcus iniae]RLV12245.1 ATP-dependent nuclease subunit B [Streptococcus iniae]